MGSVDREKRIEALEAEIAAHYDVLRVILEQLVPRTLGLDSSYYLANLLELHRPERSE